MKNLTVIYIVALSVIALVIGASQYLVQQSISTTLYDAHTINISGRQSTLSQKIAKEALAMQAAKSAEEFELIKAELAQASELWERSHNALQYGDDQLELNNVNNSEKTFLLFLELEPHYTEIRSAVSDLLKLDFDPNDTTGELQTAINLIRSNEPEFQRLMDEVTLDYDNESSDRLNELSRTEYALLAVALILLLVEAMFIFRPAISQISLYTKELEEKETSLQQSLTETHQEKEKVEYLNRQAESIFENVDQGIFLIDEKFAISELYSKSMEKIFEEQNLAGMNFIQLMRPRLVKRDQEALEMFIKHLYNSDIEEEVLSQLNPVEQVEIFSAPLDDASIESRYIMVSFARIKDGEKILAVLVTVTDETDTVLMQKKIAASEERNKKESVQLLNILRVEPVALKEFLEKAHQELTGISERYEQSKDQDFRTLINFTFSTIHNLKGNSTLIDLELISDKLHELEDTIVQLREKVVIEGRDFLKILFEINEVRLIVTNMQRLLSRMAEVNDKINKKADVESSNEPMVISLRKGLAKLSAEASLSADLEFADNGVALPTRYRVLAKDVLIQLFRNSLAHGIKEGSRGTLSIDLSVDEKGNTQLRYKDDGAGLDLDRIAHRAIEAGLADKETIDGLTDIQIAQFIFEEGFSTSENPNQLAGRGQGMNVIKDIIGQVNGSYELVVGPRGFEMSFVLPKIEKKILTELVS